MNLDTHLHLDAAHQIAMQVGGLWVDEELVWRLEGGGERRGSGVVGGWAGCGWW